MKRVFYGKEFEVEDLREQGLCDIVFDFIPALEFMYLAIKNGEKILGGDIIVKDNKGGYTISYDGWSCRSDLPEQTFIETLEYFDLILKNNNLVDWKVSVVTSLYSKHTLPL